MIRDLLQDTRYGARMLRKSPGLTSVAMLSLALGIGAISTIFSFVNGIMLRPLPYQEPERLVLLDETAFKQGVASMGISFPNFLDWREQNHSFEDIACYNTGGFAIARGGPGGGGEPEQLKGAFVSQGLFEILGIAPFLGRTFTADEDQPDHDQVVILSYGLWQRRFGADPNVIGQTVMLNNRSRTVIGVMPKGFQFPEVAEAWGPLALNTKIYTRTDHGLESIARLKPRVTLESAQAEMISIASNIEASKESVRGSYSFFSIGRLKPGVTIDQARAEMTTIEGGLELQYPGGNTGIGISLIPTHEQTVKEIRPALLVLLGAVAFLLLIACANIANLLLARAASREKEIAIRTALGASRLRVLRLLLTESVILSLAGGCLGLLLALWGTDALMALAPDNIPRLNEVRVDARVFGFTLAVSLLTGIVFGLIPAIHSSKPDLNEALKESSRGSTGSAAGKRIRSILVAVEVALSLVLLIGAGLMIKSFLRLQQMNLGFNPNNVLAVELSLSSSKYPEDRQQVAFFQAALERIQSLTGVQSAAATTGLPLTLSVSGSDFRIEGRPEPEPGNEMIINTRSVSPGYFGTLGIPLIKGRDFSERDKSDAPKAAIINNDLARIYFPDEDPMGKRITFDEGGSWISIVGIIGDVKQLGLDSSAKPEVYFPYLQMTAPSMSIVVRTASNPLSLVAAVKSQIQDIDKDLPVADVKTMRQLLSDSVSGRRFNMLLLTVFAVVALVLASVGIYGVMSYAVSQRTHEIGIRMALGAQTSEVLKLVVGQGMVLTFAGVATGLVASMFLTRLMSSLLFGVTATDPLTFAAVSVLLAGVALGACFVPARRAAKVDPMVALRYE